MENTAVNRSKTTRALFGSVVVAALFLGCSTRLVDYTLLSTKNVDLSRVNTFTRGANRVVGKDTQFWLIIIPVSGNPNMKEAIDRAVERVPGAVALVDGVVYYRAWWFIFGQRAIIVEGSPLIDPAIAAAPVPGDYVVSYVNPETGRQEQRSTDETTFRKLREFAQGGNAGGITAILGGLN